MTKYTERRDAMLRDFDAEVTAAQAGAAVAEFQASIAKAATEGGPAWVANKLEWDTEKVLTALHREQLIIRLGVVAAHYTDPDEKVAALLEQAQEIERDLIRWSPLRSTGPVQCISEDCKRQAMQSLTKDGWSLLGNLSYLAVYKTEEDQ